MISAALNLDWLATLKKAAIFVLVSLLLWPLALLFSYALKGEVWQWIYESRVDLLMVLARTLGLALLTAFFSLLWAIPSAWLTERTQLPGRSVLRVLFALPLAVAPYVGALSYVNLVGPRGVLFKSFGIELPVFTILGAAIILSFFTFPFVYLATAAAIAKINTSLEEVASSLGRSKLGVILRITLPLCLPAIFAGANLVVLYVLGDFGAVSFLRIDTFTARIYDEFEYANIAAYTGLSTILVAIAFLFLILERQSLNPDRLIQDTGRSRFKRLALGRTATVCGLGFCSLVVLASLLVPIAYLVFESFGDQVFFTVLIEERHSLWVSLQASFWAASIATLIGALLAPFVLKRDFWGRFFHFAPNLSYVLPGTILGILVLVGMIRMREYVPIQHTIGVLVFAYICKYLIQTQRLTVAGLCQINPNLMEAAQSLGASKLRARLKILLPLITPALVFGWMLIFVSAMKELAATLILKYSPNGIEPLSVRIWTFHNEFTDSQRAASAALILLLFTLVPFLVLFLSLRSKLERVTS